MTDEFSTLVSCYVIHVSIILLPIVINCNTNANLKLWNSVDCHGKVICWKVCSLWWSYYAYVVCPAPQSWWASSVYDNAVQYLKAFFFCTWMRSKEMKSRIMVTVLYVGNFLYLEILLPTLARLSHYVVFPKLHTCRLSCILPQTLMDS